MTDTQNIKDRLDIVQFIGEYLPLKKSGANWKANCPFHNEKSPSFMVHQDKQIWHCFGCSKGGDVFSFVQEMEGLTFSEALRLLAKRAGVEVDTYESEINQSQRNRLLEINTAAAYFFHRFLLDIDAAKAARDYLERRQLKTQTILDWQVGYISDQWELLTKYLLKKGFGIDDLVAAGLTIKREGADATSGRGYYDRFRGRVMFPISDTHGNIVGFTGRVLVETENSGGKYVNTPQTLLYDKSRVLYGLNKAKTGIKAKDLAVLVEGQMDVIACHQAGMTNVIAASGTALTSEQIKLIKRYTSNVAIAFDADLAGQKAGMRGIDIALEEGLRVKIISIPAGFAKDADECLKKDPAVWFQSVELATNVMDWYFTTTLTGLNRRDAQAKQRAATTLLEQIARLPYAIERDDWLKKLGNELSIEPSILREESKKIRRIRPITNVRREGALAPVTQPAAAPDSQLARLARDFWSLILNFPEQYGAIFTTIRKEYFVDPAVASLYEKAQSLYNENSSLNVDMLRDQLAGNGTAKTLDILLLHPYSPAVEITPTTVKKELEQLSTRLRDEWRRERRKEIQREIVAAEKEGDSARLEALFIELQSL